MRAEDTKLFPHSSATQILSSPKTGSVADRLVQATERQSPTFALVAEDGSAIATWVGTVSKVNAKTGATFVSEDRYRVAVSGKKMTAFNVSQEAGIRSSHKGAIDLPLKPIVLLDSYRTLCVNGALSAGTALDAKRPRNTLFLALIDDRQRGKSPNLVRTVRLREEPGPISAIGMQDDRYILRVGGSSGARFLAVNPKTLANDWIKQPKWSGFEADLQAMAKVKLGFHPQVKTRWANKTYFTVWEGTRATEVGLVWNGKTLEKTGDMTLIAASVNGKFAWLVDRGQSKHWILER